MIIDSIQNGIVIDHISAGKAMELYRILGLDKLDCTVAILKNVTSGKLGRKDIIKIDREMELDWDLIGYVDPSITVNSIRDGQLVEKRTLKLPERIRGVLRCKNPRCITSVNGTQESPRLRRGLSCVLPRLPPPPPYSFCGAAFFARFILLQLCIHYLNRKYR